MNLDWAELYSAANIKRWRLPEHQFLDPAYGEFRAPHLKWSDVQREVDAQGGLPMVLICCDVLELDKVRRLTIPVFLFAREIQVHGDAELTFDLTEGQKLSCVIAAQRIVDSTSGEATGLVVSTVRLDATGDLTDTETRLSPDPDKGATAWVMEQGEEAPTTAAPGQAALDFLAPGDPLPVLLTTVFQIACLLSTEHPRLATDQVMWVAALTVQDPASRALSADCHALYKTLIQLMDIGGDALLVPQLDHTIYADKSKATLALLQQRAQRYEALLAKMAEDERWQDQVAITIKDKQNEAELAASLRAQSEATCAQMRQARRNAARNLLESQDKLSDLMVDFQRGIKTWQRDETIKASIETFTGVVDLVKDVTAIAASGGTLAAVPNMDILKLMGGMTVDLTKAASKIDLKDVVDISWLFDEDASDDEKVYTVVDAKDELIEYFETRSADKAAAQKEKSRQDKIKKSAADLKKNAIAAGKDVKGIVDGIMRIVAVAEKAKKLEQQSENFLIKAASDVKTAFGSIAPIGLDVVTGGEDGWAQTELEFEDLFDKLGDMLTKLGGGRAYRLELRRLIQFGRTMSQTRLALAKANNDLADAILRERSALASQRLYERYLRDLSKSRARDTALRQLAFGRVLDSKRSVFLAMEAFMRAASYFTLTPIDRTMLPNITDSVDEISQAVMTHTGKWVTSLALGKAPGPFNVKLDIDLADETVSRGADGSVVTMISLDQKRLQRWYRVRLESVRPFVDGVQSDGDLWIEITNDGTYLDRSKSGEALSFVTQPFARSFVYNPNDEDAAPAGDSTSIGRFAEDFFKPTPFSTWRFVISRQDGEDLDLSGLTGLRLSLMGSVMS